LGRGTRYTSDDFRDVLKKNGVESSMAARRNCYDNAVVERFYNRKRRHDYVGNISPVHYENRTLGLNSGVHET
jgi:transposase InsO family protein